MYRSRTPDTGNAQSRKTIASNHLQHVNNFQMSGHSDLIQMPDQYSSNGSHYTGSNYSNLPPIQSFCANRPPPAMPQSFLPSQPSTPNNTTMISNTNPQNHMLRSSNITSRHPHFNLRCPPPIRTPWRPMSDVQNFRPPQSPNLRQSMMFQTPPPFYNVPPQSLLPPFHLSQVAPLTRPPPSINYEMPAIHQPPPSMVHQQLQPPPPPPPIQRSSTSTESYTTSSQTPDNVYKDKNVHDAMTNVHCNVPIRDSPNCSSPDERLEHIHPLNGHTISFKRQQDMVDTWLAEKRKTEPISSKNVEASNEDSAYNLQNTIIKEINAVPLKLRAVHGAVAKYQRLVTELMNCSDSQQSADKQDQLDELAHLLTDHSFQRSVVAAVCARRRKRVRQRAAGQRKRQHQHTVAKHFKQQTRLAANAQRRANTSRRLRSEADAVLCEVRGKQTETESLQQLVSALRDLRQHRCNMGQQHGYVTTDTHDKHCDMMLDGLEEMLSGQSREYDLEQRTLRVMLEHHQSNPKSSTGTVMEDTAAVPPETDARIVLNNAANEQIPTNQLEDAREALFGRPADVTNSLFASYTAADNSKEMLLSRRSAWDAYITKFGGSSVPIVYVDPPTPGEMWGKWLE